METMYYNFLITDEEARWFLRPELTLREIQIFFEILLNTVRPEKSNHQVLIVSEVNMYDEKDLVFFCCVISKIFKSGIVVIVLGGDVETYKKFISSASKFTISKKKAKKLLDSGFRKTYQNVRNTFYETVKSNIEQGKRMQGFKQATFPTQKPVEKQFDYDFYYRDDIESYVNDLNKQLKKQHLIVEPTITRKRRQLVQKYVSDPSLSILNVSKKNRPIIQEKRKQYQKQLLEKYGKSILPIPQQQHQIYRKKIMEYRDKQQKQREQTQRQWMEKQQILSKINQKSQQKFKQQIKRIVDIYGDDIEKFLEEVVLKELGLIDPITYEPIQRPILLPSSSIVDQSSIQKIMRIAKDPITNQDLPQNIKFQVDEQISSMIKTIAKSIEQNMKNPYWTLETKVYKLLQLLQKWRPLLDQKRIQRTKIKYPSN